MNASNNKNQRVDWEEKYHQLRQEYDDFIYSMSHDYGAPIRHIKSFSTLLLKKYQSQFDASDLEYYDFVKDSSQRLDDMQAALNEYVALDRKTVQKSPYFFGALLKDAFEIKELDNASFNIAIKDDIPIACDKHLFAQMLSYILDNAHKFSHSLEQDNTQKNMPPCAITAKLVDKGYQINIHNDGLALPQGKEAEAFLLYKKLHNNKDIKGVGAGLAMAKKIADKHGNITISLLSNVGANTTAQIIIDNHAA